MVEFHYIVRKEITTVFTWRFALYFNNVFRIYTMVILHKNLVTPGGLEPPLFTARVGVLQTPAVATEPRCH
jgi:hypothetical protein